MSRAAFVASSILTGVFSIIGMIPAGLVAQDGPVIRSGTDLVHFGVVVTDKRGNVVRGLTRDDFEIVEQGTRQTIATFAEGTAAESPDLHLGVMLDSSGSMLDVIESARTALIRFLNRLPEALDMTLVDFADDVKVSLFQQSDFPRLVERVRGRKVKGQTALYDAFTLYLGGAGRMPGRHVLAAFTDGGNSAGQSSYVDLISMSRASQVTIYIVGLMEHQPINGRAELQMQLRRIAEETGGQAIFPSSMKQVDAAYDRIVDEVRSQYSLGYVSSDTRRDGRWRSVKVRLIRPGHKDLRVRTRSGYYGPR